MLRRIVLISLLLTTVLAISLSSHVAGAQQAESLAPKVIDVAPPPGAELSPGDAVTIFFDQPMDRHSVEQAITFDPALKGKFAWSDAQTVDFQPDTSWQIAKAYTVTVGEKASATNGLTLEGPYRFKIQTLHGLSVADVAPANGATDVAKEAKIVVSFSRPVIVMGSESERSPLTISPEVAGTGEWINTSIYVFTPSAPLATDTKYTVSTTPGLKSADGLVMADVFRWSFHTLPPQVTQIDYQSVEDIAVSHNNDGYNGKSVPNPQAVYPNTRFAITFSEAVDPTIVERVFSLTEVKKPDQKIPVRFTWNTDKTDVVVTLVQALDMATAYEMRVAIGNTKKAFDFLFNTVPFPAVKSSFPVDGATVIIGRDQGNNPAITFNVPMNLETLPAYIQVTPLDKQVVINPSTYGRWMAVLNFAQKPDTTYTVTVKAGAQDIFGNRLAQDYTFSYRTVGLPPTPPALSIAPITNGDLMIFPTYRGSPRLPVQVIGDKPVKFGLYRLPGTQIGDISFGNHQLYLYGSANGYYTGDSGYYDRANHCKASPAINQDNLIRTWTQAFIPGAGSVQDVRLTSEVGGTLPLGLYWLTVGDEIQCSPYWYTQNAADLQIEKGPQFQVGIAVANANITLKRGTDSVFVFLTDLQTASPIPKATVKIYGDGQLLATGPTDATGAAQVPLHMQDHRFILVTAETAGVFGAWYNTWYSSGWRSWAGEGYYEWAGYDLYEPQSGAAYIYTDRPIYRPGDTVHFRGVLREKRDMLFPVSQKHAAYIKIGGSITEYGTYLPEEGQQWTYQGNLQLTDYGTFSGDYKIPEDAPLGALGIWVSLKDVKEHPNNYWGYVNTASDATVSFQIAAYRAAEMEVSVKSDQTTILQGDPLKATARVRYYFGGAVRDAGISWSAMYCPTYFEYTGPGDYSFMDGDAYRGYYDYYGYYGYACDEQKLDSGSITTGTDGTAQIQVDRTAADTNPPTPIDITLEATVSDESGQPVSSRTTITAHPASVYVGIGTASYVATLDKAMPINLITVTPDSKPKPNQTVTLTVEHYVWGTKNHWGWGATNMQPQIVTTGADGKAQYLFKATESGRYRLRAETRDEKGRHASATTTLWVISGRDASWYHQADDEQPAILTDRDTYQPGDTAQLLIPAPMTGKTTVLITAERAGVIWYETITSDGPDPILAQMPITEDFAPNAYITATYLQGVSADNPRPTFKVIKSTPITIQSTKRQLTISLKASQGQLKPGETATFDLTVTDADGKPVVAEVGVKLVDKAVLDLLPDNAGKLFDAFFDRQGHNVYTDISIDGLLQDVDTKSGQPPDRGGGGGGGGAGVGPAVRQNYQTTPLWSPQVITDTNGHATLTVKMPDNLTTFRLDARAITSGPDLKVGQATLDIFTALPLIVRPVTPRFLVVGDVVELVAVVNNNTESDQTVKVSLQAKGIRLTSANEQTVQVLSSDRTRVSWQAVVEDAPGADLTFYAIGQNGAQDAAKPALTTGPDGTIPIYRFLAAESVAATNGVLRESGSKTEAVTLPPRLNTGAGELTVQLDPTLASAIIDSFTFLRQYPFYCIEQTTSTFLPNVTTYKALAALYQQNPQLEADLKTQIDKATTKLAKEQKSDGSWGWWPDTPTDPLTSAYAALGLVEMQKASFPVDQTMLDKAVAYVQTQLVSPVGLENWQLNRQAFYLYVLSRAGKSTQADLEAVYAVRTRLSYASRAYLLMAFHEHFSAHDAVKTLTSDLLSGATFSSNGVYWDEPEVDWWNWGTNTRTTALALTALIRVVPQSDVLPNAVRWLMAARQGDHWPTTQETVWSITALTEWMTMTGELQGNYRYDVRFGGQSLASATISPTANPSQTLHINVTDLQRGTLNKLSISRGEGAGALYYAAQFNMQIPAAGAKAVSNGISIQREYFLDNNTHTPIQSAQVGDLITVRLTITTAQDLRYFALEDMYPAGAEPVDPNLLTTSDQASGPSIHKISHDDPYWYWGWWYFDHTELRDQETNLYASYLPHGTYVYTYQIRAATPGTFQVIPTHAYTFYFSDIAGRSAGALFTILPNKTQ